VGFTECVGSVHRKLWRSLTENVKLAHFGMVINIGCISDGSTTHYLFLCCTQCSQLQRMQTAWHAIREGQSISSQILHTKSRSNSVPQAQ
jgi:6,7-dimethyl-8-ribityllumazine synthase